MPEIVGITNEDHTAQPEPITKHDISAIITEALYGSRRIVTQVRELMDDEIVRLEKMVAQLPPEVAERVHERLDITAIRTNARAVLTNMGGIRRDLAMAEEFLRDAFDGAE